LLGGLDHTVEVRAVTVYPGEVLVFIHLVTGYPVVFGIFGEDFNLVGDAVAVSLVLIVAGKSDIKGRAPFN